MKLYPHEKIGILGYGEVGRAVAQFYEEPLIKDITREDGLFNLDVLNVCIPFEDKEGFCKIVIDEIKQSKASLTIIHSTVSPGTTRYIKENIPEEYEVAHSPVRGIHPFLYEGLKTFVKYVSSPTNKGLAHAIVHLQCIGYNVKHMDKPETSELAKLLSTTYYGMCIAWTGEMKKFCDEVGVDFNEAVRMWNETYNEGYTELGHPNFARPILYSPDGPIGGHCVTSNARLLEKIKDSTALELIKEYS